MTIDSYLDSGALRSACTEYIIYLQNENDSYNTVLSRIDAFLGNTSSDSVAINALKSQLSNYIPAVNLLIKANEYDIDCCHKLCDNCGSGVYDGYEILRNESKTQTSCINNLFMSESNKNKFNREIEQLANSNPTLRMLYNVSNFDIDDLSKNPTLYNTFIAEVSKMDPVLATYAQQMAQRKVLAAINKTEYNYWHSRHIEFDEIENLSNGLFVLSKEYRRMALVILGSFSTDFHMGLSDFYSIYLIIQGIKNILSHDITPNVDKELDFNDIDINNLDDPGFTVEAPNDNPYTDPGFQIDGAGRSEEDIWEEVLEEIEKKRIEDEASKTVDSINEGIDRAFREELADSLQNALTYAIMQGKFAEFVDGISRDSEDLFNDILFNQLCNDLDNLSINEILRKYAFGNLPEDVLHRLIDYYTSLKGKYGPWEENTPEAQAEIQRRKKLEYLMNYYIQFFLQNSKHSELYTQVYDYLTDLDYPLEELCEIVLYWKSVDHYDSLFGHEMPEEWCEKHCNLSGCELITPENFSTIKNDSMIEDYLQSYYILDMLNLQEYAFDDLYDLVSSKKDFFSMYKRWIDYMFGPMFEYYSAKGMSDFTTYNGSIRAVKYYLQNVYGIPNLSTGGHYPTYTNDLDEYTRMAINTYLGKEGYYDDFYETDHIWTHVEWGDQLIHYILTDDHKDKLTQNDLQFLNSFYSELQRTGTPPYRSLPDVIDALWENFIIDKTDDVHLSFDLEKGVLQFVHLFDGEPSVLEIPIGPEDYTYACGNIYINHSCMLNISSQFAAWSFSHNYHEPSFDEIMELVETVNSLAESFGIDLDSLSKEEYNNFIVFTAELLYSMDIYSDLYLTARERNAGNTLNNLKKCVEIICLFSFASTPLSIICFGASIFVGGMEIYVGRESEGYITLLSATLSLAGNLASQYKLKTADSIITATGKVNDFLQNPLTMISGETQEYLLIKFGKKINLAEDDISVLKNSGKAVCGLFKKLFSDYLGDFEIYDKFGTLDWLRSFYHELTADQRRDFVQKWNNISDVPFPGDPNLSPEEFDALLKQCIEENT